MTTERAIQLMNYYTYNRYNYKVKPLYSCSAKIRVYPDIVVASKTASVVLVSYNTPIAVYNPVTGELNDLLRVVYGYTNTSNQHIHKFKKWLEENGYPVREFTRHGMKGA